MCEVISFGEITKTLEEDALIERAEAERILKEGSMGPSRHPEPEQILDVAQMLLQHQININGRGMGKKDLMKFLYLALREIYTVCGFRLFEADMVIKDAMPYNAEVDRAYVTDSGKQSRIKGANDELMDDYTNSILNNLLKGEGKKSTQELTELIQSLPTFQTPFDGVITEEQTLKDTEGHRPMDLITGVYYDESLVIPPEFLVEVMEYMLEDEEGKSHDEVRLFIDYLYDMKEQEEQEGNE